MKAGADRRVGEIFPNIFVSVFWTHTQTKGLIAIQIQKSRIRETTISCDVRGGGGEEGGIGEWIGGGGGGGGPPPSSGQVCQEMQGGTYRQTDKHTHGRLDL